MVKETTEIDVGIICKSNEPLWYRAIDIYMVPDRAYDSFIKDNPDKRVFSHSELCLIVSKKMTMTDINTLLLIKSIIPGKLFEPINKKLFRTL